jgi:uncharacterized damage-inducible protein DinB
LSETARYFRLIYNRLWPSECHLTSRSPRQAETFVKLSDHVGLMASYNEWMNWKLYEVSGALSAEALTLDRHAFFGSLLGTLNHIVVADTIWLKRFALHPANYRELDPIRHLPHPPSLDQILFADFGELSRHRKMLDAVISSWANGVTDADLNQVLQYANTKGVVFARRFFSLVMHFFNHQTHHRGQATTMLSQAGIDVGITDLLALIQNEAGHDPSVDGTVTAKPVSAAPAKR